MPLLSRLFGRKHRDDDKTPTAEWPIGAQPLGAGSFGASPSVAEEPRADHAQIVPAGGPEPPDARGDDASEDMTDAAAAQSASESAGSEAEAPAALEIPENALPQAPGWSDEEHPADAPAGEFEAQSAPLEAGDGLSQTFMAGAADAESNSGAPAAAPATLTPLPEHAGELPDGISAGSEEPPDSFSALADEPADVAPPPVGEVADPFSTLSLESSDDFAAPIEPFGALTQETADAFATPASIPIEPFNALAAASSDAFEMPIEEGTDPFGSPSKEPFDPPAHVTSPLTGVFGTPGAAAVNLTMKLAAEAHEIAEAPESRVSPEEEPARQPVTGWKHLDSTHDAARLTTDAARLTTFAVPPAGPEPHTLIGGKEDDLVPLIPDTETDEAVTAEIDESGIAEAAVASLKGACDFLVMQVKKLGAQQDTTRVVAGMIALVGELDARYALDMGIRRRNGVEELLIDVRGRMAEGDRFVLESLENGRGGLTADSFLRDLKTIAPSDRPRLLGHYVVFLTFMIKRVLHQYLRPLEEDQTRTYEISYHLDYLVEGVRDMLVSKVSVSAS